MGSQSAPRVFYSLSKKLRTTSVYYFLCGFVVLFSALTLSVSVAILWWSCFSFFFGSVPVTATIPRALSVFLCLSLARALSLSSFVFLCLKQGRLALCPSVSLPVLPLPPTRVVCLSVCLCLFFPFFSSLSTSRFFFLSLSCPRGSVTLFAQNREIERDRGQTLNKARRGHKDEDPPSEKRDKTRQVRQ